jgi:geranyl diphosphate 2-C-methyltransferase
LTVTEAGTAAAPVPTQATCQSTYQTRVADYWNAEENPVNLELGKIDDLYHHHYGIGDVDWSVLDEDEDEVGGGVGSGSGSGGDRDDAAKRRDRITAELHRLEQAQADLLASHLGALSPTDRVFDAGCGRGGGSVVAHLRYGCHADGVTISRKQADFANDQARKRSIDDKVRYHHRNMLDTGCPSGAYAASWNNESTMYVELDLLFAEHARLLRRGGRYVTITGCYNDAYGRASREVSLINAHPYWELRKQADHLVTGIEETFLSAYENGSFQYLLIAADRI